MRTSIPFVPFVSIAHRRGHTPARLAQCPVRWYIVRRKRCECKLRLPARCLRCSLACDATLDDLDDPLKQRAFEDNDHDPDRTENTNDRAGRQNQKGQVRSVSEKERKKWVQNAPIFSGTGRKTIFCQRNSIVEHRKGCRRCRKGLGIIIITSRELEWKGTDKDHKSVR